MHIERMSDQFRKYHTGLPIGAVFHEFTGPDVGGPHDHPCRIEIFVLRGGYTEIVYWINEDDIWDCHAIDRAPGDHFFIEPEHIHEILDLWKESCWTLAFYEPHVRQTRFYQFDDDGYKSRKWNESEYT